MYDYFHGVDVAVPDYFQLRSREISGDGSVRHLGGDGRGLGISGFMLWYPVFPGRLEKAGTGVMSGLMVYY